MMYIRNTGKKRKGVRFIKEDGLDAPLLGSSGCHLVKVFPASGTVSETLVVVLNTGERNMSG
jgi:hypothetical protein